MSTDQNVTALERLDARYIKVYPGSVPCSVGGQIHQLTGALASPAGSPVTLRSTPIQWSRGGSLFGDKLTWAVVVGGGIAANNANAKNVSLTVGGTTVLSLDLTASTANTWWFQVGVAIRTYPTTVTVVGFGAQGPGTPTFVTHAVETVAGLDLAGSVTLATVVTQGAAGDVTQDWWTVDGGAS